MSKNDIAQLVYSGPIINGLDDNDLHILRTFLNGLLIDIVSTSETAEIREISFIHSRVVLNAQYSSGKVAIKLFGEKEDVDRVKSELDTVYEKLFKRDSPLSQP